MSSAFKLQLPNGELCDCLIRVSRRCRSVSLRLSSIRGLELVVPPFLSLGKAKEFAARNAPWVQRTLEKRDAQIQERQARPDAGKPLPESLDLKASGESFPIDYVDAPALGFVSVRIETPGRLTVQGDLKDIPACQEALKGWLRLRAAKLFAKKAEEIAKECGFRYDSIRIRDQKGRWGSCSHKGRINLNFRLLLMEPQFLRHVIIHELCHTKELNHSPRFWNVVERFEPDAKRTKAELRKASHALPSWLSGAMEL